MALKRSVDGKWTEMQERKSRPWCTGRSRGRYQGATKEMITPRLIPPARHLFECGHTMVYGSKPRTFLSANFWTAEKILPSAPFSGLSAWPAGCNAHASGLQGKAGCAGSKTVHYNAHTWPAGGREALFQTQESLPLLGVLLSFSSKWACRLKRRRAFLLCSCVNFCTNSWENVWDLRGPSPTTPRLSKTEQRKEKRCAWSCLAHRSGTGRCRRAGRPPASCPTRTVRGGRQPCVAAPQETAVVERSRKGRQCFRQERHWVLGHREAACLFLAVQPR